MDWQEITRFGLPTFILAAVALGLWQFARWFSPKVDTVIAKHIELIDTLKANMPEQTRLAREQLDATQKMGEVLLENQHRGFAELEKIRQQLPPRQD